MKVTIRPIAESDADAIQSYASDAGVADTCNVPHPYPAHGGEYFARQCMEDWKNRVHFVFAVEADGEFAGVVSLNKTNFETGTFQVGYWVGRPFWGRGIATAATDLALKEAFHTLGLNEGNGECLARNPASGRALEKNGFREMEPEINSGKWGERFIGETVRRFLLERPDWEKGRRLRSRIAFLVQADALKEVERRSYLFSEARRENSAEHSWHLILMAMTLAEHANEPVDILRVIRMLAIHDLVEIDAGDTFCYDDKGNATKREREEKAAARIFGLLPEEQCAEFRALWEEFEAAATPEARFAAALDRMMPMLHNLRTRGRAWQEHGVTSHQVLARNEPITLGSAELWAHMKAEVEAAMKKGFLRSPTPLTTQHIP